MDATTAREGEPSTGSETTSIGTAILEPFRDTWLAGRTRLGLLASVGLEAAEVSVEAYRSNLILTGDVASREISDAAERTARDVPGVGGVSNHIRIRGAQCLPLGGTDAEIRVGVTACLRQARALRGSIVTVESVYDGVVRLAGAARDAHACQLAFTLAVDVPGVRRVINDVVLQLEAAADSDAA